jgi:hypothetical protein
MPDQEDSDETRVQAVADGIRQMLDGPNSAEDVDLAVEAAMGDEEAGHDAPDPPDDVTEDRVLVHQPP